MPALHQGRRSTCRRHCAHVKVCRATSRRVCRSHCTDRPLLARAAGSITIPTGIDRLIGPEQLDSSAVRSACRRAVIVGSCGGHGHTWAWRSHCCCSACACMGLPWCMCSVLMHPVDTVGSTAEKQRSECSSRALPWTSIVASWRHVRAVAVPGDFARFCEIWMN